MNEKDFINLMHDVKRHQDAVMEDAKEMRRLKIDVWELSNLVRLLAAFVPRPVSGMVEEKAELNSERSYRRYFRNMELRGEHFGPWDKILLPGRRAILALLCQTILKKAKFLLEYGAISWRRNSKQLLMTLPRSARQSRRAKKEISA